MNRGLAGHLADLKQGVQVTPCRGKPQGIEVVCFELLVPPAATAPQQSQHVSECMLLCMPVNACEEMDVSKCMSVRACLITNLVV